jgi:hypothetical protein
MDAKNEHFSGEVGDDGFVYIRNTSHFFHFDGGNYQFTGQVSITRFRFEFKKGKELIIEYKSI